MNNETKAPRPGMEFWDKLNALPRFAFFLSPSGNSVQRFEDKALGNWIDVHDAQKVIDQAQEEINQFRAERDALQLRLNAADQRIDELTTPQHGPSGNAYVPHGFSGGEHHRENL